MKLSDIATFVEDKISSNSISLADYVTTDSLFPNKEGKTFATNLPPVVCSLTHYREGDVLVANIRPYLKKVWLANKEGGASTDVLVFRVKKSNKSSFLYAVLLQDRFFEYAMKGAIGSKMPRGDKEQIMRYELPTFSPQEQENIGNIIIRITKKMQLNRSLNHNLEAMAKQLYNYWFVQFDFPNEEGKPYKLNGGKMVWNDFLKRNMPEGWFVGYVKEFIAPIERGISYSSEEIASPNGFPMLNLACYSKAGDYRVGEMKYYSGHIKEEYKVFPFTLLIACTDMTQGADVIGRPILATEEYEWYVFSMDLAKITPNNIGKMYLYYTLRTPFYHRYIKPFASGTTVKHLNVKGVEDYKIAVPPICLQKSFENTIEDIKHQQMLLMKETLLLTKLRDELLPLLMNGQVSVNYDLSHD